MAWDGSGNFDRTDGTRTGTQVWQDARDAGVKIVADDHDTHDQDIADGIENTVALDGQNTTTTDNAILRYDSGNTAFEGVPISASELVGRSGAGDVRSLSAATVRSVIGALGATADKSSTSAAEAGTADNVYMTPAKTVDHLDQYGPRAGLRNAVINGDFRINQRSVSTGSALSLSNGEYFFDRWRSVGATTGIQVATDGTVTLGANEGIEQVIEGRGSDNDNFAVNGDSVTVSVDTPAGNLTVTLLDYSETDTASGTISSGSGRKGVTLTVPALDADGHMIVKIEDASGASNTFKEVQVEKGSIATPFERRPIGTELSLCKRYARELVSGDNDELVGAGVWNTSTDFRVPFRIEPEMRSAPSLTVSAAGDFAIKDGDAPTGFASANNDEKAILFTITSGSGTTGDASYLQAASTSASAFLDAEL